MKYLNILLLLLLAGVQYRLWVGNGSIPDVRRLKGVQEAQIAANAELAERNRSLAAEVMDLKQGSEALEERARSEMGMIRAGETFFQYVNVRDPAPAAVTD
ncbi:MAG: cell division protein FtsB [Gammaproteobacteria bacterium]|nr:cell division protein FtsB [Gammaproteobacteria bacterium]